MHLYSGKDGTELIELSIWSEIDGGPDFDADGWSDLLLGDPNCAPGSPRQGAIRTVEDPQ